MGPFPAPYPNNIMGPKKEAPKAEAKGKKPVPKKTVEKASPAVADEKKAPLKSVQKAQKVQKKIVKGTHGTRVKKVRTSVHFRRPRTYRPSRNPILPAIAWMLTISSNIL